MGRIGYRDGHFAVYVTFENVGEGTARSNASGVQPVWDGKKIEQERQHESRDLVRFYRFWLSNGLAESQPPLDSSTSSSLSSSGTWPSTAVPTIKGKGQPCPWSRDNTRYLHINSSIPGSWNPGTGFS